PVKAAGQDRDQHGGQDVAPLAAGGVVDDGRLNPDGLGLRGDLGLAESADRRGRDDLLRALGAALHDRLAAMLADFRLFRDLLETEGTLSHAVSPRSRTPL